MIAIRIKTFMLILLIFVSAVSCNKVKQKAKETVNEGGEIVGKTATEFAEGISEGVERTLDCEIVLSQALMEKGLKTGKYFVGQDSAGNDNNLLRLYLIFDKTLNTEVSAKVFDKNGLENGRAKLEIGGVAGDARYYDFLFDKNTHIEVKSKITIE